MTHEEELNKAAEEYTHVGATNDIKEISKAEKAALKAYPNILFPFTPLDLNAYRRGAFIQGYQQAEKDLALTIEDLELLHTFLYAVKNNKSGCFTFTRLSDEQYQEVLRRFNERKK